MKHSKDVFTILDAQYGSCGKGAIAQWLGRETPPDVAVRTGGPNAGHTVIVRPESGKPKTYSLRHIPAAAVEAPNAKLVIPPAGVIDPQVLAAEIAMLENAGYSILDRLYIDRRAVVITNDHRDQEMEEGMRATIGSTAKGIGAATADKVMRTADTYEAFYHNQDHTGLPAPIEDVAITIHEDPQVTDIHIEMTQGFGLSLNAGKYYPYATSRDITPMQGWNDALINPVHCRNYIFMVARTLPIRVAGNSGDAGGKELSWDELADRTDGYIKPEKTTVTQLTRRIFEWDEEEVYRACRICHPTNAVLTFADYIWPDLGRLQQDYWAAEPGARPDIKNRIQERIAQIAYDGELDKYRRPFERGGHGLDFISIGFGDIYPVSFHD